ncbi:MAG: TetR family transcriptional regulator [Proteobacteria bacterium]|nr:TetR family transcriptional regulator [Pseudomonadota bacterium]
MPQKTKLKKTTPEQLIDVGQSLFAEKGFAATTVQDIAKRAKVNVSLISYYFKGKEGLFRQCVARAATSRLEVATNILVTPKDIHEFKVRIEMFTDEMLTYQVENPSVCTILHRDLHTEMEILGDIFEDTLLKAFNTFVTFIAASKDLKILASWIDPELTASNFYAFIFHLGRSQEISAKYFGKTLKDASYRQHVKEHLIKMTLEGILNDK